MPQQRYDISGSSAERTVKCTGSLELKKRADIKKSVGDSAKEGTAVHALAEQSLLKGKHPRVYLHTVMEEVEITQEMVDAAMIYINVIKEDLKKYGLRREDLHIEQTFGEVNHKSGITLGGTPDCYILTPDGCGIILYDLKYGKHTLVEASDNYQLLFYTALILKSIKKRVRFAEHCIVQPRAYHPDGTIRRSMVDAASLADWTYMMSESVKNIRSGDTTLCTGDHCQYCEGITICPEVRKDTLIIAKEDFTPESLNGKQISRVLSKKKAVLQFLKEVEETAIIRAKEGEVIPDFKLVEKRGIRQWNDKVAVMNRFLRDFGGKIYKEEELKSPTQLEKVGGKGKVDEFVVRKEGFTLVHDADSKQGLLGFEKKKKKNKERKEVLVESK